jgi:hypothetical protein
MFEGALEAVNLPDQHSIKAALLRISHETV